jgi:hypothetical protein
MWPVEGRSREVAATIVRRWRRDAVTRSSDGGRGSLFALGEKALVT